MLQDINVAGKQGVEKVGLSEALQAWTGESRPSGPLPAVSLLQETRHHVTADKNIFKIKKNIRMQCSL